MRTLMPSVTYAVSVVKTLRRHALRNHAACTDLGASARQLLAAP